MNNRSRFNSSKKRSKEEMDNKRLVGILNSKMFKGYRQINAARTFGKNDLKFVKTRKWELAQLEPFEDNYNLQYKKVYLNTIKAPLFYNPFSIENLRDIQASNNKMVSSSASSKKSNVKVKHFDSSISKPKSSLFIMTETSKYESQEVKEEKEKKRRVERELFGQNSNEQDQYSVLPFFIMEKKIGNDNHNIPAAKMNKRLNGSINEQEIQKHTNDNDEYSHLNQPQFLFKISREQKAIQKTRLFTASNGLKKGFNMRQSDRPLTGLDDYKQVTIKVQQGKDDKKACLPQKNLLTEQVIRTTAYSSSRQQSHAMINDVSTQTSTEKKKSYLFQRRNLPNEIRYYTDQVTVDVFRKKREDFKLIHKKVFDEDYQRLKHLSNFFSDDK